MQRMKYNLITPEVLAALAQRVNVLSTDRSQQITVVHILPLALLIPEKYGFGFSIVPFAGWLRLFMNEQSFSQVKHQVRLIFQLILVDVHSHRHYQITTNILA